MQEKRKQQQNKFADMAEGPQEGIVKEFVYFLLHNKKWWLIPIIVVLLLLGLLIVASGGSAPFIYAIF